jgi:hypothetical protein
MAIYRLLQNSAFGPDHIAVITEAFEDVCKELGLAEPGDPLRDLIARAIIDCAQKGEREAVRLRECAREAIKD